MARLVRVAAGQVNIFLPDGRGHSAGELVVLTDAQFAQVSSAVTAGVLVDLGPARDAGGPPVPQENYLLGWAGPPEMFVSNNRPTAGEVYLQALTVSAGTISKLWYRVTSSASGLTAGQNWVGLYDATGARLAVSADLGGGGSLWTSTGNKGIALATPVTVTNGQKVYAAFLFNGTTAPQLAGGAQGLWDQPSIGPGVSTWVNPTPPYNVLAPQHFRYMSWSAGVTTLPATIDLNNGNPDQSFFVGVG